MKWTMWARRASSTVVLAMVAALITLAPGAGVSAANGAARAAAAGTIVFVKDYNVWLVRPDGTGLYQVTTDGTFATPYLSPSMSDAGIIAAGHGLTIVQMRQNGQILNRMDPPPLMNSVSHPTDGPPVDVAISPDGRRIAYSMVSYSCPIGASCGARSVTGVTDAGALSPSQIGLNYYSDPSWVGNGRLMTHGGYGSNVMLQDLGGAPQHWYDDEDVAGSGYQDLSDGEISRDGTRLAIVRSYGATTHLQIAAVTGNPSSATIGALADPSYLCATNDDARINSPSWGPDNSLVLGDSDGLVVMADIGPACAAPTFRAIAPGGSEPHWSIAALDPGPRSFTLQAKPGLKGKKVVGKKLKATSGVWSPTPATVTYRWLRNGKPVKGKAGKKRAYKVRPADRRKRLSVQVTVGAPGHVTVTVRSASVRIKR
ncbi:LpqB family beta-propeller domain-containing protein [Nocardioides sp. L-11A]|uniref:LpqB family beta-propeller domain-containing protein n=1 Tax=Nocardioides sp. L-11A TaxID=3043848 RepID=UPI00249B0167|nr:LpqB family beta-propeller domain-containing protein [Nocardioides sp. L-11A]